MKVFVGIATSGRDAVLSQTLRSVASQTHLPEAVFVCKPRGEDEAEISYTSLRIVNLLSPKGSCAQRNAILDVLGDEEGVLLIMDDDFVLHPHYLHVVSALVSSRPDIALINGRLLADGISGPGLTVSQAESFIEAYRGGQPFELKVTDIPTAYGCNMAINLKLVGGLRFDELLPLYGWQEDVDFSVRLKRAGRIVGINAPAGVHLGIKTGRTSGLRFGYSQIINPIYLLRKGTMRLPKAMWLIGKNLSMNILRSAWPEPYLDRRGRLKGNALALVDVIRGRGRPDRISEF
jgi:GT2 family glycosyltransferase